MKFLLFIVVILLIIAGLGFSGTGRSIVEFVAFLLVAGYALIYRFKKSRR